MTLIVLTSSARAETLTLLCQNDGVPPNPGGGSFTLRVDYDGKIVALLYSDGTEHFSAPAQITEADARWKLKVRHKGYDVTTFEGGLNRLSGKGWVTVRDSPDMAFGRSMSGPCRRATQKF